MSCGCSSGSGSNPPGTFVPTRSSSGVQSAVGSTVAIPSTSCSAPVCPTPPSSSQTGREAYTASWITTLLGGTSGKIVIKVGDTLEYFRGLISGYVRYNAQTEEITVGNDPFMSNEARSTNWGRLAKVLPVTRIVQNPETGECTTELVSEVASQNMGTRVDGQLVLANFPQCGDLPSDQAGDAGQQVRFDKALLPDAVGGEEDTGLLVGIPGTRQNSGQEVQTTLWKLLKALIFRQSMAGKTVVGSSEYNTSAVFVVAVPTGGGTVADPAYRLKFLDKMPPMLPLTANEGDGLVYRNGQWIVGTPGTGTALSFHPITPTRIITSRTTSGSVTVAMPSFPADATTVWAMFRTAIAASGSLNVTTSSIRFALATGASIDTTPSAPVSASTVFTFGVSGSATATIDVLGYYY